MTDTTKSTRATPSWRRFEIALITTARRLRAAFDQHLEVLDLNLSQATLLAYVTDFGSSTQTQLAEMIGMGRAATGTMIDHLEQRGLLERLPDPTDRRVWLVAATAEGRDLVDRFYELDADLRQDLRKGISRRERQQLTELLDRLGTNIDLTSNNQHD
ncbi:MAG: MarR family winged helix-turn-helix transcriptional regulator [Acidimicrobiales bacterium]